MENKTIKLLIGLIVLVIVVNLLFFTSIFTGKVISDDKYQIGLIIPQTGTFGFYGEKTLQGAKLAIEENPNFELIVENDEGENAKAVSAANKLIAFDEVDAVSTVRSSISAVVSEVTEKYKVPMLYSSSVDFPAGNNSYVFKNYINIKKDCEVLAEILENKKGRLLGHNLDSTRVCIQSFEDNGFNLAPELFDKGKSEFRTELLKIKEADPDFLIIRGDMKATPQIFKQMKELGMNDIQMVCPHITGAGCNAKESIEKYSDKLEGAIGTDVYVTESEKIKDFDKRFKERFSEEPIDLTYSTYENIKILISVIESCEGVKSCVVEKLETEEFEGLEGPLRFNGQGIVKRRTNIMVFEGGEWGEY